MSARRLLALPRLAAARVQPLWECIRVATGEADYERYVAHMRQTHPGEPIPSAREFYANEMDRRWSGVQRCC